MLTSMAYRPTNEPSLHIKNKATLTRPTSQVKIGCWKVGVNRHLQGSWASPPRVRVKVRMLVTFHWLLAITCQALHYMQCVQHLLIFQSVFIYRSMFFHLPAASDKTASLFSTWASTSQSERIYQFKSGPYPVAYSRGPLGDAPKIFWRLNVVSKGA